MAVNYSDWTNSANELTREYHPILEKQFHLENPTFESIRELKGAKATSDGYYIKMLTGLNEAGQGVLPKSPATLREAHTHTTAEARIRPVFNQHFMQIDLPSVAEQGNIISTGMDKVELALEQGYELMGWDLERQIWGKGTGELATVASVSGQVVTLATPQGTQNLHRNMVCDIVDTDGTTENVSGDPNNPGSTPVGLISDMNEATPSVTFNSGTNLTSVAAGDTIYRYDSKDVELDGIQKLVDDGTIATTVMNINTSTTGNGFFKARRIDAENTALSIGMLERAFNIARRQIGENAREQLTIVSNDGQQSQLFVTESAQRRYVDMDITAGPPKDGVKYVPGGKKWKRALAAPYGEVFVGLWDTLVKKTVQPVGACMYPDGGWQRTSGVAAIENFIWCGHATGITTRKPWVKIVNLTEAYVN